MSTTLKEMPVKGGVIVKDEKTGHIVEVRSERGVSTLNEPSLSSIKRTSNTHRDALKRLVDR
ncbi:MAG: hypothetical protein AAGK92_16200 [Pseudomonadota bacterium]